MEISAAIYIFGSLSLLFSVLLQGGAAVGQEPIQIYYGTNDEREIYNETTINVTDSDSLLRMKFVADGSVIIDMISDTSNLNTSFYEPITHQPSINQLINTHLLQVRESGSIIVYGVLRRNHNTDYHVIIHFDVQREDPTMTPTTTESPPASTMDTPTSTTTTTLDATSHTPGSEIGASSGNTPIESSTLIAVVVVVVIVALVVYIVTVAAVVIYYRNKLKKQQQNCADTNQSA